ncbi:pupal cuticle protein Edg-84A-like [Armigeres subalbatus]|uniref:pupal cuticle protein Edg-84A-like n=1 Tax=Armigeres subalbatus TaxID=124917 RepID=UPI002ED06F7D
MYKLVRIISIRFLVPDRRCRRPSSRSRPCLSSSPRSSLHCPRCSSCLSHSSSHVVHHAPVVKHAVVAHASPVVAVHHAPVLTKTVVASPVVHAVHTPVVHHTPVLAKTVVAAPVVHAVHTPVLKSVVVHHLHPQNKTPKNLRNRTKTSNEYSPWETESVP